MGIPLLMAGAKGAYEVSKSLGFDPFKDTSKKPRKPEDFLKEAPPPPLAPDITDQLVRDGAKNERAWLQSKRGRKSTFLGGDY